MGPGGEAGAEVAAHYQRGWQLFESWDGVVRVGGNQGGERFSVKLAVVLQRPGQLYLEAMLPLGKAGPVVATAEGELRVLLTGEGRHLQSPADARSMRRLMGLAAWPQELIALLAGFGVPWDSYRMGASHQVGPQRWLVELQSPGLDRRAAVLLSAAQPSILEGVISGTDGGELYRFRYQQQKQVGSWVFPSRIHVESGDLSLDARLAAERRNAGRHPLKLFRPEPPPGSLALDAESWEGALLLAGDEP
jgi:hypothetical protein